MGQVGRIALTLTGAAIGAPFGQIGLGAAVGGILGGLLFPTPAGPATEGPRLKDLTVTSSAYGQPITEFWGTMRLNGNVIWSAGIREHKHTSKVKAQGGKGMSGPAQKQVTYTYSCSFAVGLCQGVADKLLRIWADTKLIYDVTGEDKIDIDVEELDFEFYRGTEDQMPDAHIVAHQGDDAPAYRGLCYIMFEDFDLTNFANRIPNITVEVTKDAVPNPTLRYFDDADHTEFPSDHNHFVTDAERGWFINKIDTLLPDTREIKCNSIRSGAVLWSKTIPVVTGVEKADVICISPGGSVIVRTLQQSTAPGQLQRIERWDAQSGVALDTLDFLTSNQPPGSHPTRWYNVVDGFSWDGTDGLPTIHCLAFNHSLVFIQQSDGDFSIVDQQDVPAFCSIRDFQKIEDLSGYAMVWQQASQTPTIQTITRIRILKVTAAAGAGGASISVYEEVSFTPAEIDASLTTTTQKDISGMIYDPTDETLLMTFRQRITGVETFSDEITVKYDPKEGEIIWKTTVRQFHSPGFFDDVIGHPTSYERGAKFQQTGTSHGRFRMTTGEYIPYTVFEGLVIGGDNVAIYPLSYYNGDNNWGIGFASGEGINPPGTNQGLALIFYEGALAGSSTVAEVVKSAALRSGLLLTDLQLADLEEMALPGYAVAKQVTARDLITPLAQMYLFDSVESDGVIKFFARGKAAARQLTQADIVRDGDELKFAETRIQETDLPVSVSITYADPTRDYQEQTFTSKRMADPIPTMHSDNRVSTEFAGALSHDFVKRQTEILLYSAWEARSTYELTLTWAHIDLDPTDVFDLTMDDGTVFRARFTTMDLGADLTIDAKSVSETDAQYISTVVADPGDFPGQTVPSTGPTRLFVLDTVLLRDEDDNGGGGSRYYIAMGGYGQAGWTMGVAYRGLDADNLDLVGTVIDEVTWGTVTNALPDADPESCWGTDEVNFIDVMLATNIEDGLDSSTYDEVLHGANAAAIIRQDGQAEIIQFRTAEETAPGVWRLTNLLRGRRGSDAFMSGHAAGDTFVLLEPAMLDSLEISLAQLGVTQFYRGVQAGRRVDSGELVRDAPSGNDLMPYAPVHLQAAIAGADIAISWVRRTRLRGELRSGDFEVPLAEATEAYEVDIMDGFGVVLRTLNAATPAVTYTAAQITADFGSMPVELQFAVYQISAAVGRGFGREVTRVL